jgi:hypothetical protein
MKNYMTLARYFFRTALSDYRGGNFRKRVWPVFIIIIILFNDGCDYGKPAESSNNTAPGDLSQGKYSAVKGACNNLPIAGSVNTYYSHFSKKQLFPWHTKILIAMNDYSFDGLPRRDEAFIAFQFEHEILDSLKKKVVFHYIGHVFFDGFLEVHLYSDSERKISRMLNRLGKREDNLRQFGFEIKKDPEWKEVQLLFQNQ